MTSKALSMKEQNYQVGLVKIRTSALQDTLLREWIDKPKAGRKYLEITYLVSRIYEELTEFNRKKTIQLESKVFGQISFLKKIHWW